KKEIEQKKIEFEVAGISKSPTYTKGSLAPKTIDMIGSELKLLQQNEAQLLDRNRVFTKQINDLQNFIFELLKSDEYAPITLLKKAYGPILISQIRSFLLLIMIFVVSMVFAISCVIIKEVIQTLLKDLESENS
ncbi:MAG: hypothetical protein MJK18_09350, partial [Bdellovibrionales bacterium]|nr:hypothetical protein [Bdellovibrionales bacterium]